MPERGEALATGWDLGGAHLKVAQGAADGSLEAAFQLPCTLWRGLDHLTRAIGEVKLATRRGVEAQRTAMRKQYND
mgnify:CR=1 FL=1